MSTSLKFELHITLLYLIEKTDRKKLIIFFFFFFLGGGVLLCLHPYNSNYLYFEFMRFYAYFALLSYQHSNNWVPLCQYCISINVGNRLIKHQTKTTADGVK